MISGKITLEREERFKKEEPISGEKLLKAAQAATDKLEANLERFTYNFTSSATKNYVYEIKPNSDWINGMHTGLYWLAYELTGNKKFCDAAQVHLKSFKERFEKNIGISDHDVGFVYVPSCVAAYKVMGDETARTLALQAAKHLYEFSFSKRGGFIIRSNGHNPKVYENYRTMMDTLMNISLFLWAHRETGDEIYLDAAKAQYKTTLKYLVRADASTFHHYQFDPKTDEPVKGVTWQGFSDDSCWARGQAWGIYGLAIAYAYTADEILPDAQRDISYYFLNKLPKDYIVYWDLIFEEGSTQPRDSSAGVIAVCGFDEMAKHLSGDIPQKQIFKNAFSKILNAHIDKCGNVTDPLCDGILKHVTHALPQGKGIDEFTIFGDYFYLEALMRAINPHWSMYW